jgi:hypothetical protein
MLRGEASVIRSDEPQGISLEKYAGIAAEIAEGVEAPARVLARSGLSPAAWEEAVTRWTASIAAEAFNDGETPLADAYNQAFVLAQDGLKPVPEMTIGEWARLEVEVGRYPGVLREKGITSADLMRLRRTWARALSVDRALAKRYAAAVHAALAGA